MTSECILCGLFRTCRRRRRRMRGLFVASRYAGEFTRIQQYSRCHRFAPHHLPDARSCRRCLVEPERAVLNDAHVGPVRRRSCGYVAYAASRLSVSSQYSIVAILRSSSLLMSSLRLLRRVPIQSKLGNLSEALGAGSAFKCHCL